MCAVLQVAKIPLTRYKLPVLPKKKMKFILVKTGWEGKEEEGCIKVFLPLGKMMRRAKREGEKNHVFIRENSWHAMPLL